MATEERHIQVDMGSYFGNMGAHPLSNSWGLARAKSSRSTVEGTETSAVHLGGGGQLTGTHKKSHQPMVARGLDFKAPACGKDCSLPAAAPQACMQP